MSYPPKPDFKTPVKTEDKFKLWGKIEFKVEPQRGNPENIVITNGWDKENIVSVEIEELRLLGLPHHIQFHRKGSSQLRQLFMAWGAAGLMPLIKNWGGTYCPRLIRGGTSLSNHAFGTAFDINVPWNPLGAPPAEEDHAGTVIPLVAIANQLGFFWGGHYEKRKDGMHFELVRPYVEGEGFQSA